MYKLIERINKKINSAAWSLIVTGATFIPLAIVIAWTDLVLRLIVSVFVLLMAFSFIIAGYKLWHVKNEVEKFLKLK
jgi:ABC-type bacteriocin/lantibiotic exporter with double-glycine peptidase domain